MSTEERALRDIRLNKFFEMGQRDSYLGRPMRSIKGIHREEFSSYLDGYHSMMDRKSYE